MDSEKIRIATGGTEFWLREIAAQLAELNQNIYDSTHPAEAKLRDAIKSGRQFSSQGFGNDNQI